MARVLDARVRHAYTTPTEQLKSDEIFDADPATEDDHDRLKIVSSRRTDVGCGLEQTWKGT